MKQLVFAPILFVVSTAICRGDHGANPFAEIPLWQIVTVAVFAVVVFFLITAVRRRVGRRKVSRTARPHLSGDDSAP